MACCWYLEDYAQAPFDPNPIIAAGVERRMGEIGIQLFQLFRDVFQADDAARDLWATLRGRLNETRVEIVTEVRAVTAIPWELLRDPATDAPLAVRARSFVRAHRNPRQRPQSGAVTAALQILLVICRPAGDADVPFRSVAGRLVGALGTHHDYRLDVLRPPTFAALSAALDRAQTAGQPYHIVHFDGHGVYTEPPEAAQMAALLKTLGRVSYGDRRMGPHGYLVFEDTANANRADLVDGERLGQLLVTNSVPVQDHSTINHRYPLLRTGLRHVSYLAPGYTNVGFGPIRAADPRSTPGRFG